jgi:hypothetical protein
MGKGAKSKAENQDSLESDQQILSSKNSKKHEPPKTPLAPPCIIQRGNLIYLTIRGKPNSKWNAITYIDDESISISIACQPVDGAANK